MHMCIYIYIYTYMWLAKLSRCDYVSFLLFDAIILRPLVLVFRFPTPNFVSQDCASNLRSHFGFLSSSTRVYMLLFLK